MRDCTDGRSDRQVHRRMCSARKNGQGRAKSDGEGILAGVRQRPLS